MAELLALLTDSEVSPKTLGERLRDNTWTVYREQDRRRLRPLLTSHLDQIVRACAAEIFEAWQDIAGLLELVQDSDFLVRKNAFYHLGQLPPAPGVADLAWGHLCRADTLGVHATETLATFVRHAPRELAEYRLTDLVHDVGQREGLRVAAVGHLRRLGAVEEVRGLIGLLQEPPGVTWALHLKLLQAVADLRLPRPDIRWLREVDHLHVQKAIAEYCLS